MASMARSPDILYSISQVNALTGVPKSTIRFWEKEFDEFLIPLRTAGNQRRYDSSSVNVIESINQLVNEEGYTLEGARRKMRDQLEPKTSDNGNGSPKANIDELAETMSDYLLKKLFEHVQTEEAQRNKDF